MYMYIYIYIYIYTWAFLVSFVEANYERPDPARTALVGPPVPSWAPLGLCGPPRPLWAPWVLVGRALVGFLGACGPGPCGPVWAVGP